MAKAEDVMLKINLDVDTKLSVPVVALEEGQRIIFVTSQRLNQQQADAQQADLQRKLPDNNVYLVHSVDGIVTSPGFTIMSIDDHFHGEALKDG